MTDSCRDRQGWEQDRRCDGTALTLTANILTSCCFQQQNRPSKSLRGLMHCPKCVFFSVQKSNQHSSCRYRFIAMLLKRAEHGLCNLLALSKAPSKNMSHTWQWEVWVLGNLSSRALASRRSAPAAPKGCAGGSGLLQPGKLWVESSLGLESSSSIRSSLIVSHTVFIKHLSSSRDEKPFDLQPTSKIERQLGVVILGKC